MRRLIAIALSVLCVILPLRSLADALESGTHCARMQAHLQVGEQPQAPTDPQALHHAGMHAPGLTDGHTDGPLPTVAPADTAGSHSCCNDAATFASTGQLCKMGQECSPSMTYLLPPTVLQAIVPSRHAEVTATPILFHNRPPAAVWRPPSLS